MTGDILKSILKKNGIKLTDIAVLMGESPQNLNSKLNAKKIDLTFFFELVRASKLPISEFLPDDMKEANTAIAAEAEVLYSTDSFSTAMQTIEELKEQSASINKALREEIDNLKKEIAQLSKTKK